VNTTTSQLRLTSIRKDFERWNVDSLLIGSPANRSWLSGFTGSAGWLLITRNQAILATDFRYWDQATQQAPDFELFKIRKQNSAIWQDFITQYDVSAVGVEANHLTVQRNLELDQISTIKLVGLDETVESHRAIKTAKEIEIIKKAAAITDRAMAEANNVIRVGVSERELAWQLEKLMREAGADSMAFPVIVASGPNGAMAHHTPGNRILREGDAIIIDMGATIGGLNSDLTRSFLLSNEDLPRFREVYDLVLMAQESALNGIKAGITGRSADRLARDVIEEGGYGTEFGHSLGHGIGLEVHENPRLSHTGETKKLPVGSVVTIEPGIYIHDWGGIRIEDLVVVTETGIELLSHCPKNPIVPAT